MDFSGLVGKQFQDGYFNNPVFGYIDPCCLQVNECYGAA
jgi:hypothetical protein